MTDIQETQFVEPTQTLSCGALLARHRNEQQLSREDIATALRLTPDVIRALEMDDAEYLPEETFVRGYLRSYSRLLGVDEQEVLHLYESAHPLQGVMLTTTSFDTTVDEQDHLGLILFSIAGIIAVVLVAFFAYNALSGMGSVEDDEAEITNTLPSSSAQTSTAAVSNSVNPLLPKPLVPKTVSEAESSLAAQQAPGSETTTDSTESAPASAEENAPSAAKAAAGEATEAQAEAISTPKPPVVTEKKPLATGDELRIVLKKRSWVDVRDNKGKRHVYKTLPKGTDNTYVGQRPFWIYIGNAPSVDLYLNGDSVDLKSHTRENNTARFKLK